jgi:DNA polymerase-3 subunit alpha
MTNIVSIKNIGLQNSFDLEVNHSDHQFYLSNNVLTSNSHSILYSITSYVTAYLKANFPIEFLLGNLMAELAAKTPNSKINVEKIKKELRQHRIKILPPDINDSDIHYKIVEANKLLTGLEGIKFVSEEAIQDIVIKRPFTSFADFMNRVDSSKVRANTIQALANSGCLDSLIKLEKGLNRKIIHQYCSDYRKKLQVWLKKHSLLKENFAYPYPNDSDWTSPEMYSLEHHYIGESFTCKPAKAYGDFFADGAVLFNQVKKAADKDKFKSLKGIVRDFFEFKVKKEDSKSFGKSMVKISLEDAVGDYITINFHGVKI